MTIRIADSSQNEALLLALGRVTFDSAHLANMLQQLASTITGSQHMAIAFEKGTLWPQVELLKRLMLATNWNPHVRHPEIADDHRNMTLAILGECSPLITFRNRISHDIWTVWPSDDVPDRLEARKPMRWSDDKIETSIRSVNIVARQISLATVALSSMEARITGNRDGRRRPDEDAHPEKFLQECEKRKAGKTEGFLWRKLK